MPALPEITEGTRILIFWGGLTALVVGVVLVIAAALDRWAGPKDDGEDSDG